MDPKYIEVRGVFMPRGGIQFIRLPIWVMRIIRIM